MDSLTRMGEVAKDAARKLALFDSARKQTILSAMAQALVHEKKSILEANAIDMKRAKDNDMSAALQDRLRLTSERIDDMANGLTDLIGLADPIGKVEEGWRGSQNLLIERVRVPLGVVGIIYEARPNVTADVAGICIKTGNAVILRGGSDALESNRMITRVLALAAEDAGAPHGSIQLIEDTSRETAAAMMRMNGYLDVLIPRGGAGLIKTVVEQATVPVIETGTGNCHLYIDTGADLQEALKILINGKCQRPGVCNAVETLLVHEDIASEFLPLAAAALRDRGVELRGCAATQAIVSDISRATDDDYKTEYLDLILAVKVVSSTDEAICHINTYGSGHSEAIVTPSYHNAESFLNEVDAAAVYVNSSTRFTDGGMFGFGAEVGISTQKLHSRGPMGLEAMTTIKYKVRGNGQIRG